MATPSTSEWICEQHPWLEWPHHDCAGPGMPASERENLHEDAGIMANIDKVAFQRLIVAVRAGDLQAARAAVQERDEESERRAEQSARTRARSSLDEGRHA